MIPEFSVAWAAVQSATKGIAGILKTVQDVKTKQAIADILDALLDVQAKLSAAQSQYEALAEVKRKLEQKIVEYEKWDTEAARYKLQEIAKGIFVYVLQPDQAKGEPIHWLCPGCFQQHQKSILQKPGVDYLNYKCHRCAFEAIPTTQHYPETSPGEGFDILTPEGY
jgi:hypothetical protein